MTTAQGPSREEAQQELDRLYAFSFVDRPDAQRAWQRLLLAIYPKPSYRPNAGAREAEALRAAMDAAREVQ